MGAVTVNPMQRIPWQDIGDIQQHPGRDQWKEDEVVRKIDPDALMHVARLFVQCAESDSDGQIRLKLRKWEANRDAIRINFEVLRDSLKETIQEAPSLCNLLDVKPDGTSPPPSPKRQTLESSQEVLPLDIAEGSKIPPLGDLELIEPARASSPSSPKGPAPTPSDKIIPPAITENGQLAELLGYYKALELQIDELEAVTTKKIDKTNLAGELARILKIKEIWQQCIEFLKFFQAVFEMIAIKKDGNCLPRSIVQTLKAANDPTYGQWQEREGADVELEMANKLKNDLIAFMRSDEEFMPFVSNLPRKDVNYSQEDFAKDFPRGELESEEEYFSRYNHHRYRLCLNELEKDGCYFSMEFIAPLAKMLKGYKIYTYAPHHIKVVDNQIVLNDSNILGTGERPLYILHLGEHFWAMKPLQQKP